METVTVYRYKMPYHSDSDYERVANRMATREFIERNKLIVGHLASCRRARESGSCGVGREWWQSITDD
jgi:hypothetical protein